MTDHIDLCECGHDSIDHVRVTESRFPCLVCTCIDHAPVVPDGQSIEDITVLMLNIPHPITNPRKSN